MKFINKFSEKHPVIWQGLMILVISALMAALVYVSFLFDALLEEFATL